MDEDALLAIVASRRIGQLATIKRDGRAQLSVVSYAYFADEGLLRVSVTAPRAKTRNLMRDPRASMLIMSSDVYKYAVVESTASFSAVAASPEDAAVEELITLYRTIAGEHSNWDEFRQAMITESRLVLRLPIERLYGQG
jgi:PPOX class probable F420-dependent enzyme